jgi:DNA recombination protein RmuC
MPDFWTAVVLLLAVAAVIFILWRIAALHAATKDLPSGIESAMAEKHRAMLADLHDGLSRQGDRLLSQNAESGERLQKTLAELNASFQARQDQLRAEVLEQIMLKLAEQARADRELLQTGLTQSSAQLSASMESLTRSINERLEQISGRVSERLDEGFKKTNETFANVMARLATIDEAQKKIDGLTSNVVSLQELLGDKKARGAFGEVQLEPWCATPCRRQLRVPVHAFQRRARRLRAEAARADRPGGGGFEIPAGELPPHVRPTLRVRSPRWRRSTSAPT